MRSRDGVISKNRNPGLSPGVSQEWTFGGDESLLAIWFSKELLINIVTLVDKI
jgi:hypothetical protein